jgi:hypothetical protein
MTRREWTVEQAMLFLRHRIGILRRDELALYKDLEAVMPNEPAPFFTADHEAKDDCWVFRVYPNGEIPSDFKRTLQRGYAIRGPRPRRRLLP